MSPEIAITFFDHLLKPLMQNMKKDFCKEWFGKITKFFQMAFDLGYNYYKKNAEIDISKLDEIESAMI